MSFSGVSVQICSVRESWGNRVKCLPGDSIGVGVRGSTEPAQSLGSWVTEVSCSLRSGLSPCLWHAGPSETGSHGRGPSSLGLRVALYWPAPQKHGVKQSLLSRARSGELPKSGKPSPAILTGPYTRGSLHASWQAGKFYLADFKMGGWKALQKASPTPYCPRIRAFLRPKRRPSSMLQWQWHTGEIWDVFSGGT